MFVFATLIFFINSSSEFLWVGGGGEGISVPISLQLN